MRRLMMHTFGQALHLTMYCVKLHVLAFSTHCLLLATTLAIGLSRLSRYTWRLARSAWCVRPPQQLTSAFDFVGFAFYGRFLAGGTSGV